MMSLMLDRDIVETCFLPNKKTETLKATNHKNKETRNGEKPTCQKEGYTGDILSIVKIAEY